jgi:hypothetical protein
MTTPSFWRIASKQFWLLFGGIWFLVGIVFGAVGAGLLWSGWQFRTRGESVEARVLRKYSERGSKGSFSYHLDYEFRTGRGDWIAGKDAVDRAAWERAPENGTVRVQYLPDQPGKNRVPSSEDDWQPPIFAGVGLVFGGIGGVLTFRSLSRVSTILRVLREGIRADATVLDVRLTNVSINRIRQSKVRYAYNDFTGVRHEGESDYVSPVEAALWQPGERGTVRYDQNRPELSYWVGREDGT